MLSVSGDVDTNPGAVKHSFRSALKHTQRCQKERKKVKGRICDRGVRVHEYDCISQSVRYKFFFGSSVYV